MHTIRSLSRKGVSDMNWKGRGERWEEEERRKGGGREEEGRREEQGRRKKREKKGERRGEGPWKKRKGG